MTIIEPGREICLGEGVRALWWITKWINQNPLIDVCYKATVEDIAVDYMRVQVDGIERHIEGIDLVVISAGMISDIDLGDRLKREGKIRNIHTIGDCVWPRKMLDAMAEGRMVGCSI